MGVEIHPHKKIHAYRVVDNLSFPLFHPDWGVSEHLGTLLSLVSHYHCTGFDLHKANLGKPHESVRLECVPYVVTLFGAFVRHNVPEVLMAKILVSTDLAI